MFFETTIISVLINAVLAIDFNYKGPGCKLSTNDGIFGVESHSYFITSVSEELTPCRSVSDLSLPVDANYDIFVDLQSTRNSTPGIVLNIQDDDNYDMVFFRTEDKNCVFTASIVHGEYKTNTKQNCSKVINHRNFFKVQIKVRQKSFTVTIDEDGPFTFTPAHPIRPSLGFMQGLTYKHLCGDKPCEFNFRSLTLNPDTTPDTQRQVHGQFTPWRKQKPNQLQVHRIDLHTLGREKDSYCVIAVYFRKLNIFTSKMYIEGVSNHSVGMIRFNYIRDKFHEIYFYLDGKTNTTLYNYTIHYHVLGCDIPKPDLSFACEKGKHFGNQTSKDCWRSTGFDLDNMNGQYSDESLPMGWYDLSTCAGNTMPTHSPEKVDICGSHEPVWLKPPDAGINSAGLTNGTACVYKDKNHECAEYWDLPVYGCGQDQFLYYLVPTSSRNTYCAGDLNFCDPSLNLTAIGGSECVKCWDFCIKDDAGPLIVLVVILSCAMFVAVVVVITCICRKRTREVSMRAGYRQIPLADITPSETTRQKPLDTVRKKKRLRVKIH